MKDRNLEDLHSSGFGDLLIFPRYDVYYKSSASRKTEITIGLGYKIPLGSNSDSSVVFVSPEGEKYYAISGICPHAKWPLELGTVKENTLTCGGHGWEFNISRMHALYYRNFIIYIWFFEIEKKRN